MRNKRVLMVIIIVLVVALSACSSGYDKHEVGIVGYDYLDDGSKFVLGSFEIDVLSEGIKMGDEYSVMFFAAGNEEEFIEEIKKNEYLIEIIDEEGDLMGPTVYVFFFEGNYYRAKALDTKETKYQEYEFRNDFLSIYDGKKEYIYPGFYFSHESTWEDVTEYYVRMDKDKVQIDDDAKTIKLKACEIDNHEGKRMTEYFFVMLSYKDVDGEYLLTAKLIQE